MFQYLISPLDPSKPLYLVAITVENNVITAYEKSTLATLLMAKLKDFPIIGRILRSNPEYASQYAFDESHDQYAKNLHQNGQALTYGKPHDSDHNAMHFSDARERDVMHMHMRHKNKITVKTFKAWLANMKDINIPREIRKDILAKFKKYIRSNTNSVSMETNNPFYRSSNKKSPDTIDMPSIAEHANCLWQPNRIGCVAGDSPVPVLPAATSAYDIVTPIVTVVATYALYRMFKPVLQKPVATTPANEKQPGFAPVTPPQATIRKVS